MSKEPVRRLFYLLLVCALAGALFGSRALAFGRRQKAPAWVADPAQIETMYPGARYLCGLGVSAGASRRDVLGRKEAEKHALADVAANVEVQIKDTLETHDSEVFRNGKSLRQNVTYQTTKRVVRGLLSGTEIKAVFFDRRTMTWHALAVLERAKAGRGGVEAINERLNRAETALARCGQGKPLSDFVALRALEKVEQELDWLGFAVAMFVPSKEALFADRIAAFRQNRFERLAQVRAGVRVAVVVRSSDGQAVPPAFVRGIESRLKTFGLPVVGENAAQVFDVVIEIEARDQVGAVRLVSVSSGARYVLRDGNDELVVGRFKPSAATTSRARSLHIARRTSLGKLQALLLDAIGRQLEARMSAAREK